MLTKDKKSLSSKETFTKEVLIMGHMRSDKEALKLAKKVNWLHDSVGIKQSNFINEWVVANCKQLREDLNKKQKEAVEGLMKDIKESTCSTDFGWDIPKRDVYLLVKKHFAGVLEK